MTRFMIAAVAAILIVGDTGPTQAQKDAAAAQAAKVAAANAAAAHRSAEITQGHAYAAALLIPAADL